MTPAIIQTLRGRWLAIATHAGLWVLLLLSVRHLGGNTPLFREANPSFAPPQTAAPVARLDALYSSAQSFRPPANADLVNPFLTRYFGPAPAGPPPTTRRIELTYQGFFQTADGPTRAIVKLGDAFIVADVGALVETNLFVAQATMQTLTLTNRAAQTNVLTLNSKKELEVPLK
jgi:hypothetical protein